MMQQMSGQAPLPPEVKALVDVQMAETQRKAAKDQTDAQISMGKLQSDQIKMDKDLQARLIMNTEDNLTAERIKSAELTRDAAALQHEQVQTALSAQQSLQSQLGGNNV